MNTKEKHIRFKEIIEQHQGILLKVARTYCQNQEDRQDLIQEISIQIWRSIDKYNNKYKISTWLYRIALNVSISFYRKSVIRHQGQSNMDVRLDQVNETNFLEKEVKLNLLEQFIYELNEFDKALILLYLEGKSHSEIGDILGTSTSNIGTKIGRIKEKLKKRFSELKE